MTTTNLGRITIVPKGTWAAGSYKALDLVRYNGASYIAKSATTASPTDTTYWQLVNSDGAAGPTGATGPTGSTGSTGATGAAGPSLYTWIKYADDASGTGLADTPTDKSYIGIAVNQSSATESTLASDYSWSLIKGDTGATGATGATGPQGPAGTNGTGTVNSVAALTITTTGTDLTSTVANGTTTPVITINVPNASASARGVLTPTDWTTFNSKQSLIPFGTNVRTWIEIPSSANLAAAITDETGTGRLVFATNPTLVGVKQTRISLGSPTITLNAGDFFTYTVVGNTTFSVSDIPSSGIVASFILRLTNGGAYTLTWFSGIKWAGGVAPSLSSNGIDDLSFYTENGGVTWTGLLLGKDIK